MSVGSLCLYHWRFNMTENDKLTAQEVVRGSWPTWPFTRLGRKEMAELIKKLEQEKHSQLEEALL